MSLAKQILFLRIPIAKECVALVLLNLFLFVQLVSVCEAFQSKTETQQAASTFYSSHQASKPSQSDKAPSLEKLTCIAILLAKFYSFERSVSVRVDEFPTHFFLSDQYSASSLTGRAPPVA